MHVAFLMTQSLESPSGLGRFGPIARQLAALGHQVEIIALHPDWHAVPQRTFRDAGVDVRYVGQMHVRKSGPRKMYYGPVKLLALSLASTLRMARALAYSKADVIQLCKPQPYNVLAARIAGRGRPLYCDCDDYEAETNRFSGQWQQRIVSYFEDGIIGYVRAITANTRFTEQRYATLGFPRERILYVPNGVERARFEQPPDLANLKRYMDPGGLIRWKDPIILYAGSLGMVSHAVDLLLAAFQEVRVALPVAQLLLVGGGEDYDRLRTLSQELGISEGTVFAGRVAPQDMPGCYMLASISVDPVRDDLTARARSPLKIVESLVCGTPVVTSAVGDRFDMLNGGELGLLVPAGDASSLAAGLVQILSDEAGRAHMMQQALAQRERWYWDRLIDRFTGILQM
jgi:glycosyltransferase involved in cell wall biosynthesis